MAWYDVWMRGGSLRGLPADSSDSEGELDDSGNAGFDDARSRAQILNRVLHNVLATDYGRMKSAATPTPMSFEEFEIDARRPAAEQYEIFARYGWTDGPPSPLYLQRRMVQLARERYERALAAAERDHPNLIVTFPRTFDEFQKAPYRNGQFYFLKPRGRTNGRVHEDDSLDEHDDDVEHDEYEHYMHG